MVEIEEVSQTSSEATIHTTQSSSPNTEDEEQAHIENNLNLKTPLSTIPSFGTLEWITKEGWLVFSKRRESGKWTQKVNERSNNRNKIDHNLLGLFYQQVFSAKLIYSPTKKTTMTTPINTTIMFVSPIMALPATNVLRIQLPKYHDNDDSMSHL